MTADADHQSLASVAGRLGKSPRWLQSRLTEDQRRPADHQRLQHHHYIGGSKRWSETEYQALAAAIAAADADRARGRRKLPLAYSSSTGAARGTSSAPSEHQLLTDADALAALERVLAFPRTMTPSPTLKRSATPGRSRSGRKSSTGSTRVLQFPSPQSGS